MKRRLADPRVAASVHQHIIDLFVRVAEEAASCDAGVLLVFDELQALDQVSLSGLLAALSVVPDKRHLFSMVAAGLPSIRAKCVTAFNSMDKLVEIDHLEDLGRADAATALSRPAADTGHPFTPQALAKTIKATGGYPYFVQFYGFWLWEDAAGSEITVADFDRLKPEISRRLLDSFYVPKWEACSKPARRYLAAMAAVSSPAKTNANVAALLKVSPPNTWRERTELLNAGLVYERDDDSVNTDEVALNFAYPHFGEFIVREHPLLTA